ncbi:MAG: GlsB/YeaQ/YmgE family stress response membrane protein [Erysipelotrichaceae bacterium]|nr:GlsB/YeaQ/YmgE family stress response membrane protein [Erysipelotrichaceae bacterium]
MLIGIIITLAVGALVGYCAGMIMKQSSGSLLFDCLIGIAGSFVGRFIFGLLGFATTNLVGYIIASLVGAIVVIFIINAIKKR